MHHAITIFLSNRILEAFCRYTKSSTFLTFHPVTPILWKLNICQVFSVSGRNEIWTFTYTWHLSHVPLCEAYQQSLADTELCLAPRGSRVWSPRLFEMIWFGCIPATQMHFGCYTRTSQLCWNAHSDAGCAWICRLKINFRCDNFLTMKHNETDRRYNII